MSMTNRREPADARTAPQAATTSTTTNQPMAINPYPLTSAPPYGRLSTRPAGAPCDDSCWANANARRARLAAGSRRSLWRRSGRATRGGGKMKDQRSCRPRQPDARDWATRQARPRRPWFASSSRTRRAAGGAPLAEAGVRRWSETRLSPIAGLRKHGSEFSICLRKAGPGWPLRSGLGRCDPRRLRCRLCDRTTRAGGRLKAIVRRGRCASGVAGVA